MESVAKFMTSWINRSNGSIHDKSPFQSNSTQNQKSQPMKLFNRKLIPLLAGLLTIYAPKVASASTPVTYSPNMYGKSLTTPIAWGAYGNVAFIGVGGTVPSPYASAADGAAVIGAGFGDPKKNVGAQITLVSLDLSGWGRYSAGLQLSRNLCNANAVSVGVENVMLTNGSDADKSFYAVYSQGVQNDMFVDRSSGFSKLHYSIGVGNGRFGDKSPDDIAAGKGKHGTYVFGNVAYDIADTFNLIVDWNGLNLNTGVSKTVWLGKYPVAAVIGAADLTRNSGDRVRMIMAVGTGFKFN